MKRRYYISKAAQEHVHVVRDKGYTQINMGPREPLAQMNIGDWILYYSPTVFFEQDEPICEQFTGLACVTDSRVYPQSNQLPDRWRRNVEFFNCTPHHPQNFLNKVAFLPESSSWMDVFLAPLFEISKDDFIYIAQAIVIEDPKKILLFE